MFSASVVQIDGLVLVELEVLQLVDLEQAVLESGRVEDHPLLNAQLSPQDPVAGLRVALELDPANAELIVLLNLDHNVGDQVVGVTLHDLGLDASKDVARVLVELVDPLDSGVDHVRT